jgi:hypothetical protein
MGFAKEMVGVMTRRPNREGRLTTTAAKEVAITDVLRRHWSARLRRRLDFDPIGHSMVGPGQFL